jgi:hypothetical protein
MKITLNKPAREMMPLLVDIISSWGYLPSESDHLFYPEKRAFMGYFEDRTVILFGGDHCITIEGPHTIIRDLEDKLLFGDEFIKFRS